MSRSLILTVLALAAHLGSCAPELDAPPAPNLQPVLQAYANPTVVVGAELMGAVADEIEKAAKEIEDSEIFAEILGIIEDVQTELEDASKVCSESQTPCQEDQDCAGFMSGETCDPNENGDIYINGVKLPAPNGAVRINYICPGRDERQFDDGYDATPDPANGSIDLWMTLESGGIGRVVWGTAANCLYLVPLDGDNCEASGCSEASYDGGVALDLGDDVPPGQDIAELLVTFVIEGTIGFDGGEFRINQSFRVILAVESGLELLVDVADPSLSETFNYIFAGTTQGIRDATGLFGCSLEERRCFDEDGTTLFSW